MKGECPQSIEFDRLSKLIDRQWNDQNPDGVERNGWAVNAAPEDGGVLDQIVRPNAAALFSSAMDCVADPAAIGARAPSGIIRSGLMLVRRPRVTSVAARPRLVKGPSTVSRAETDARG